ncbi:VIT1/CCC1 transporter family protein [Weissella confusa]|uniref:VIT1/CCC1 transporter family protein n=1 Tax=Weissella confusa TaxID=1583 RepID=A0A923NIS8_WEICO|nr:VIT1/CCC1 transporter family protein [Weissella confusa]
MAKAPLETILATKYDVQLGHYVSPWSAAVSSLICAAVGGAFPLLAMILAAPRWKFLATIGANGLADLLACALSMASGEYASVSSQADAEKVVVDRETQRLRVNPAGVAEDIRAFYVSRGVTTETAGKSTISER